MVTNPYLNHTNNTNEQELVDDLIQESIQATGHDVYYVVRHTDTPDVIYKEDDTNFYKNNFKIEVYINNFSGYAGDGELFTKFGLEVRDELIVTVSRQRFQEEVTNANLNLIRPREGDIIYIPLTKDYFIVKYVDHRKVFYQLGRLYSYELRLQKFEYSSERFETGVPEIDQINKYSDIVEENNVVKPPPINKPDTQDNEVFTIEGEDFIDFSEQNPFSMRE